MPDNPHPRTRARRPFGRSWACPLRGTSIPHGCAIPTGRPERSTELASSPTCLTASCAAASADTLAEIGCSADRPSRPGARASERCRSQPSLLPLAWLACGYGSFSLSARRVSTYPPSRPRSGSSRMIPQRPDRAVTSLSGRCLAFWTTTGFGLSAGHRGLLDVD